MKSAVQIINLSVSRLFLMSVVKAVLDNGCEVNKTPLAALHLAGPSVICSDFVYEAVTGDMGRTGSEIS